jgi:hypothetical protein
MRRMNHNHHVGTVALAVACTMLIVMLAAPRAQQPPAAGAPAQGRGGAPAAPAPGTPPKALVPIAASTLATNPDPYYGEFVTLTGTVEQSLAGTLFSVDQDKTKTTGKDVLVIARRLSAPVDPNTYVTVIGEVVKFDPEKIAAKGKEYAVTFPPDVAEKFKGKPVILATGVINAAMVDLAKFIPPPMSAEEAAFEKVMRGSVAPGNAALRKAMEGSDVNLLKEQTAILRKAFIDTEAFWKGRGKADAVKIAQDAHKSVDAIEAAGVAGKWDEVKTQLGTLGQTCSGCHGVYRERGEDGSFYIKPGSR